MTFISQIGFVHPGQARMVFDNPESLQHLNPKIQPILMAGMGGIYHMEGNFPLAQTTLDEALELANAEFQRSDDKETRRALAYVHFEYGKYYNKLYAIDTAYSHFQQALNLNNSPKLKLLIDVVITRIQIKRGLKGRYNKLKKQVERLKAAGLTAAYGLGLQRIGIFATEQGDLEEAERYLTKALSLADECGFSYLAWTIKNSIAILLHKQEKFAEAVDYVEDFIDSVESHYMKSIVLKTLSLRYRRVGRYEESIETCIKALEYSQTYDVFSLVPGNANLAAKLINEYRNDAAEAYHYFKVGYETTMLQERIGLPITGQRRFAIEDYFLFIEKYVPSDLKRISVANYFEWARHQTWVRIQDLFFYNLFVYHFIHTGIGKSTFSKLEINSATFYSTAKRMRDDRGITFPNFRDADVELPANLYLDEIQKYIQLHKDMTYKEIVSLFEVEIYEYLFKESGYNKMALSKTLSLSYAVVLKKTKPFTSTEPQS